MTETTDILVEEKIHTPTRRNEKPDLSVILALSNAEEQAAQMLKSLIENLENFDPNCEVVCVDDGSTDQTSAVVREFIKENPRVKLIQMRTAFGEASALDAGIKNSRGDKIVYLTGRVNINPEHIVRLLQKLDEGNDLVVGWRHPRRDAWLNRIISRIFNGMINSIAGLKLHDINSSVFVARREVLEDVPIYGDLNNFIPVLAVKQGYKVAEEKIEQLPGWFRTSKYFNEYIRRFLDIITVFFLTRYSKKPIHFLGFLGAILTLLGVGIDLYLFVYRVLQLGPIAGRPLLLLGSLLLIIGIQMVSIGLIGEMIIFTHAKEIKEYNIETIVNGN